MRYFICVLLRIFKCISNIFAIRRPNPSRVMSLSVTTLTSDWDCRAIIQGTTHFDQLTDLRIFNALTSRLKKIYME